MHSYTIALREQLQDEGCRGLWECRPVLNPELTPADPSAGVACRWLNSSMKRWGLLSAEPPP